MMTHKILVALDYSEGAWGAVEYVARTFGQTPDVAVTMLHVLPGIPPAFWDTGHLLTEVEKKSRERLVSIWKETKGKKWQGLFQKATQRLVEAGMSAEAITREFEPDHGGVAEEILEEAHAGGYSTIVMGRRGSGRLKSILLGSISNKVVLHAQGLAVTIVE
jgi:nucleotide-binding universal stress UspA family protein